MNKSIIKFNIFTQFYSLLAAKMILNTHNWFFGRSYSSDLTKTINHIHLKPLVEMISEVFLFQSFSSIIRCCFYINPAIIHTKYLLNTVNLTMEISTDNIQYLPLLII